jgi:cell wall-associated NlpC family hydrolase
MTPSGDTRVPRRARLPLAVLCAAVLGGAGWLAAGAGDPEASSATSPSAAAEAATPSASQPPLPRARPKVVEPVAGESTAAATPSPSSSGDADPTDDRAPTRAASTSRVRRATSVAGQDAVKDATALPNGVALPPLEAPREVLAIIEAGNSIARTPYKWGGGHGKWQDTGYDCSGSVSFALAAAGLLDGPLASGPLMSWGEPGRGRWVTIYANDGHVFMEVAGIRFDTSGARVTGSRWQNEMRGTSGFVARHPAGL